MLKGLLDSLTAEGDLCEKRPDGSVMCYACGHRCLIRPGVRGICKVRFNSDGRLLVPWGYVGALQCDPTEKKPFYHILPGSQTLTFGMLGCDMHCPYCFVPETRLVTNKGVVTIGHAFAQGKKALHVADGEASACSGLHVVTGNGQMRKATQVFKHRYAGPLTVIKPYYLPALRCTHDHRIYATTDPSRAPQPLEAAHLTRRHYLAIPRNYRFSAPQTIDVYRELSDHQSEFKTPHKVAPGMAEYIMRLSDLGATSRTLGLALAMDPSHIRHIRSRIRRGLWTDRKAMALTTEGATVRFTKERRPGIPRAIPVDESFARLLGLYCAEGGVLKSTGRPNTRVLVFTFGSHEAALAGETSRLIRSILGLEASVRAGTTTTVVTVHKSSAALLFEKLCGSGATKKYVPVALFDAQRPVVEAFLKAYVCGDGCHYPNGKVTATTKSASLAYGVGWLSLKAGRLCSIYTNAVGQSGRIMGRLVRQAPMQYTLVWYQNSTVRRRVVLTNDFYLIRVRSVETVDYDGDVYNLEVEKEHNYLANFMLVANCQNWVTSQALRDPASELEGAGPMTVTPQQIVALARLRGADLVGSSYNEPLITSEWAVAIFREALRANLRCVYISNGNATPEVLDYIRPYVVGYKIDLKTMSDRSYRRLGAVLSNVLNGIRMVHERGFWLEIVTLVIPGFNDSDAELKDVAEFLVSVSRDIPWHVTAFHADYKMADHADTRADTLLRAARIGRGAGLRYVYAGNLPGRVREFENTNCPSCGTVLVERWGYRVIQNRLAGTGGRCPDCGTSISGIWN